jgi:hypothetical protein
LITTNINELSVFLKLIHIQDSHICLGEIFLISIDTLDIWDLKKKPLSFNSINYLSVLDNTINEPGLLDFRFSVIIDPAVHPQELGLNEFVSDNFLILIVYEDVILMILFV